MPIIGSWELLSFHTVDEHDTVLATPWGESPVGLLIYSPDGRMSAQFMLADRALFAGTSQRAGTDAEKIATADGFFAYSGTYRWGGDQVLHDVVVASFPNWIGTTLWRSARLEDDHLILGTAPNAAAHRSLLRWRRATG